MNHERLRQATQALRAGRLPEAERLVRAVLKTAPHDVEAVRLLAAVASATGFSDDAERLLRHALALAPASILAHADLAALLCRLHRRDEALALLDGAIMRHPGVVWPLSIKAAILSAERLAVEAVAAHKVVTLLAPDATIPWMNYAHALKTVGRTDEAIAAYRRALECDGGNAAAWWGLANLRIIRLGPEDIAAMQRVLPDRRDALQQAQLHFALGKALGDVGDYAGSFRCYEEANRLRGTAVPYDAGSTSALVQASEAIFTPEFLAQRQGQGCDAHSVIFIVGMPRSGSSLVEQILASHPMIEGTGELFELQQIATNIAGPASAISELPRKVAALTGDDRRALGEEYLRATRRHRRTDRPFFIDKLPSNWRLVPLIHLILPNAKIIDVRRHPLACCFSAFATYFNRETSFPTSLVDLGRYHADYVRLMAHLEAGLPGRIYRVHHERVVADLEAEVRKLLRFLGLSFDSACLRFHETERPIHTPSAQQVRRPIDRNVLDHWRNYDPWLSPLKSGISPGTPANQ